MSDILDFLWSAFAFHRIDSLPSLFFDFVLTAISASAAKHSYNQTNQQTNKKKLTKSTRDRSRSFSYRCIHMHWMTIAHTLLHSLDLRKLNQNDLEFRLARKPYDYFLFGGITNLYENNYVSTCVRAVRNAHCLRIDFRRISVAASRRNTRTKEITERKPLKTPMLSNSVRRLFSVHSWRETFRGKFSISMACELSRRICMM